MWVVVVLLTVGALLGHALGAAAQSRPPGVSSGSAATPSSVNTNNVSSGSNRNTNANSNSQFLSGNNTGVNNGSLEVYAGADPSVYVGGGTNLPQLPGIPSPPANFSQPYRPDAFVNTPPFLPAEITLDDAKRCRDAKGSWYGGSRDGESTSIKLFYAGKAGSPPVALTMANYIGTAMATTTDGPFLAALCEAAHRAMRKGATVGMVEFNIRPKNTMIGFGFGSSGGATGLPAAGAHPYAIAATLGFGTGWSNQRVEGEVVLQLTALQGPALSSAASNAYSPAASTLTAPVDEAPVAADETPVPDDTTSAPGEKTSAPGDTKPPAADTTPASGDTPPAPVDRRLPFAPRATSAEPYPAAVPRILLTAASPRNTSGPIRPAQIAYHPGKRLASLRRGQSKDEVFGLFGSMFIKQEGTIVELQGMRLRASGQSPSGVRIEVGEVTLADEPAPETPYWFLFEQGRLLAWGRPEQWSTAVTRHGIDLPYHPPARPLHEAKAQMDLASGGETRSQR